ncbi:hypothetical protein [Mycolicibacterium sp. CBMA 226]|uniref:hypothetical protein n=1 Tax=Mycolicibacterium sp. CBMA 226 TaxID=2606611 RepID=UPI001AA0D4F9|nr:hypothetical protein [Mycolicibacterium sp. CBMA 226]
MAEESYQVPRMELDHRDANRLGKWASLWADLLHVDMVLRARAKLPETAATAFTRRAFWESAIVGYGRMEASTKRRKLAHEELLRSARGDRGVDFHAILMSWRNDHVAHRLSRDFETVAVYADYLDDKPETLDGISANVVTSLGPNDSQLVEEFSDHVRLLRDTLWEKYLAPIGEHLAKQEHRPKAPTSGMTPPPGSVDWFTLTVNLWSRRNGTGLE